MVEQLQVRRCDLDGTGTGKGMDCRMEYGKEKVLSFLAAFQKVYSKTGLFCLPAGNTMTVIFKIGAIRKPFSNAFGRSFAVGFAPEHIAVEPVLGQKLRHFAQMFASYEQIRAVLSQNRHDRNHTPLCVLFIPSYD